MAVVLAVIIGIVSHRLPEPSTCSSSPSSYAGVPGYETVGNRPVVLTIIALALRGVSGWVGGELAYHYGVRVAEEHAQSEGFR